MRGLVPLIKNKLWRPIDFLDLILYYYMFGYDIFMILRFGWLLVISLYKDDYLQFFMCVLLITRLLRLVGRLGSRKPVKPHQLGGDRYTNWPSQVGPQSLCNRSFWWVQGLLSESVLWPSQISSFFSYRLTMKEYVTKCLKKSVRKLYGRYGDMIKQYIVPSEERLMA